tara:strand:+ start:222 stop:386 length:165 start_codon:yes stop_codon:yes gene_type:complete
MQGINSFFAASANFIGFSGVFVIYYGKKPDWHCGLIMLHCLNGNEKMSQFDFEG